MSTSKPIDDECGVALVALPPEADAYRRALRERPPWRDDRPAQNYAEQHLQDTGHALQKGCCNGG
jgi:hypothetical protein